MRATTSVSPVSCAVVGTDIYLLGGTRIQKYDTLTDSCTVMSATLTYTNNRQCVAVGTDIYTITVANIQKYDILTDTLTEMPAQLSTAAIGACCAAVGTNIYVFGGNTGSSYSKAIQRLMLELSLAQNNLLLTSIYNGKEFKLVDDDTAEISFNVNNAFIGNSENKAEFVDAYIYIDGAWVNVNTGEEYLQLCTVTFGTNISSVVANGSPLASGDTVETGTQVAISYGTGNEFDTWNLYVNGEYVATGGPGLDNSTYTYTVVSDVNFTCS